jgi:hypothetical protein
MSTELPVETAGDDFNPYAPPKATIDEAPVELVPADLAEAEAVRRANIGHEAAVKSIGSLLYLSATILTLSGIALIVSALAGANRGDFAEKGAAVLFGLVYFSIVLLYFFLGRGLRRLQSWARWTCVALLSACLAVSYALQLLIAGAASLIGMAIGSVIPGYILYLLLASKATTVFSPEYREIVARTPHIRRKTSLALKILLAVLVAVFITIVVASVANR